MGMLKIILEKLGSKNVSATPGAHKEVATQPCNGDVLSLHYLSSDYLVCARRTDRQRFLDCCQGFSSTLYPQMMESPQMLSSCCLLTVWTSCLFVCLSICLALLSPFQLCKWVYHCSSVFKHSADTFTFPFSSSRLRLVILSTQTLFAFLSANLKLFLDYSIL